jgi:hypothetical protein
MRKAAGRMMRRSAAQHSFALAALTVDTAPEFADGLVDYAEEIFPDDDTTTSGAGENR